VTWTNRSEVAEAETSRKLPTVVMLMNWALLGVKVKKSEAVATCREGVGLH
jgi:hypothetical protein